eukprot:m.145833 g.145833  ORF g.145833 m.145833 type:complete len:63 (+) comp15032_c0_seq1:673-861(+)
MGSSAVGGRDKAEKSTDQPAPEPHSLPASNSRVVSLIVDFHLLNRISSASSVNRLNGFFAIQ